MKAVLYAIVFATFTVIFAAGILAVIWTFWGLCKALTELYVCLLNEWALVHMGKQRVRRYISYLSEIDRYLDEKHGRDPDEH